MIFKIVIENQPYIRNGTAISLKLGVWMMYNNPHQSLTFTVT